MKQRTKLTLPMIAKWSNKLGNTYVFRQSTKVDGSVAAVNVETGKVTEVYAPKRIILADINAGRIVVLAEPAPSSALTFPMDVTWNGRPYRLTENEDDADYVDAEMLDAEQVRQLGMSMFYRCNTKGQIASYIEHGIIKQ